MVAISSRVCALNLVCGPKGQQTLHQRSFCLAYTPTRNGSNLILFGAKAPQQEALAATRLSAKSSDSDEKVPSWAKPDSEEPPPWAREEGSPVALKDNSDFPFIVYLLASAVTAIAAVGSIFEYANQKPVFGLLNSDSMFYAPVLGFFAITGIPTSAFLWYKSVQAANKEAEEQDRRDGYR